VGEGVLLLFQKVDDRLPGAEDASVMRPSSMLSISFGAQVAGAVENFVGVAGAANFTTRKI